MSVGVGMGIGRGHVTLGHNVNLISTTNSASDRNDGMDGIIEHDQISPTWSVQCWDTLSDQVDHLILLPERALTMDSGWLQADLAEILAHSVIGHGRGDSRDYSLTPFLSHPNERSSLSHDASDGWLAHSRRRSLDWSSVNPSSQPQSPFVAIATSPDPGQESCSATAAAAAASAVQREERSKVLRERQNEERQRKLEELKQQAVATQKFREQQEEERRRRMEEQRLRDLERRTQVEERKKVILEAERERREAMLRRSEDRGIRQETKRRNERGSIAFAFGSSTPRMLEPVDSCPSYWGSRRATSTTNVMSASSHGRVMLNETTAPIGGSNNNKLRASSVFGLDQNQDDESDRGQQRMRQDVECGNNRRASQVMTSSSSARGTSVGDTISAFGQQYQPAEVYHPSIHRHNNRWSAGRPHTSSLFGAGCFFLGDDLMTQSTSAVQGGRRKRTDLIPTTPIHRGEGDRSPRSPLYGSSSGASSSRGSVNRSTGLRSGDITPSSPTRPLSALSQVSSVSTTVASSTASVSGHVRARTAPAGGRKPRPVSIAGTGMSLSETARASRASRENISSRERSKETKEKENERTRQTQPGNATPRPARSRSADLRKDNNNATQQQQKSPERAAQSQQQTVNAKRPSRDARNTTSAVKDAKTPVKPSAEASKSAKGAKTEDVANKPSKSAAVICKKTDEDVVKLELLQVPEILVPAADVQDSKEMDESDDPSSVDRFPVNAEPELVSMIETVSGDLQELKITATTNEVGAPSSEVSHNEAQISVDSIPSGATTPSETGSISSDSIPSSLQSLQSRKIISSEEEAKAALAEKRRLAREQMEREAERERLRAEEERLKEEERQRQEELEQKLAEEEMNRMALEARQAEEERLQKAIEETQRREGEERLRREEEVRQRVEKEQQDRKAREEAEKMRKENEERLRREEEERQERRKRVEAIMARTRGKSSGPASSNNKSGNEMNNTESSGQSTSDVTNVVVINNSISQPDLLGDIVNKTSNGSSGDDSNRQSSSPDDDVLMDDDTTKKNNGFHHHHKDPHIEVTDFSLASTTSDLPDISNVTANADCDNSNASTNNTTAEVEHVEFLA